MKDNVSNISLLVGNDSEFKAEHQVLNGTILITAFIYLISFILNYTPELDVRTELKATNLSMVFILLFAYYFSRIKGKYYIPLFVFNISILSSLSISWFMAGGIISSLPFYYAAYLCYIIFFTDGSFRRVLVSLYVVSVITLCLIEISHPEWVKQYPNQEMKIKFMIKGFISMSIVIIYITYSWKKFYIKEKQNTIDIINQYRENGEKLKKEFELKYELLSIREREVFNLIIEGKTNQEISNELHIEIGTVKLHVNKIYKKLGTKCRLETINFVIKKDSNL
ncbi:LuxR C-terminal-related transcriptional regulator [Bacteroidota bacterium]